MSSLLFVVKLLRHWCHISEIEARHTRFCKSMFDEKNIKLFFSSSVNAPLSQPTQCTHSHPDGFDTFSFKNIHLYNLYNFVHTIKSKATGIDNISMHMLRICLFFLEDYILHIFNFCVHNSVYPDIWKSALIIPIPKTKIAQQ